MSSTRRIIGKFSPDSFVSTRVRSKMGRIVSHSVRFGRSIQLHQLSTVPQGSTEAELLADFKRALSTLRSNDSPKSKVKEMLAKMRVLQISSHLRGQLGGRKPTHYQLLGVYALLHGLESPTLLEVGRKMHALQMRSPKKIFWEGSASVLLRVFRARTGDDRPLLSSIERVLHLEKNKSLDSRTIALRLGVPWEPRMQHIINAGCHFLEICGMLRKMPLSVVGNRPYSVWTHTAYENPPIDYPNVEIDILRRLVNGPMSLSDMSSSTTPSRGRFWKWGVDRKLHQLEKMGIVSRKKGSHQSKHIMKTGKQFSRVYSVIHYSLTSLGEKLMSEYARTNHLPEQLRKILLGEKSVDGNQS